jgi:molybdopterin synthase sulfur carrier subunit
MSVTVRVPPVFRTMTGGASQVSVEGGTVNEVLATLEGDDPGF